MRTNARLLPVTQVLFIATRLLLVSVHCKCVLQETKHNYSYMFIQVYDLLQFPSMTEIAIIRHQLKDLDGKGKLLLV